MTIGAIPGAPTCVRVLRYSPEGFEEIRGASLEECERARRGPSCATCTTTR